MGANTELMDRLEKTARVNTVQNATNSIRNAGDEAYRQGQQFWNNVSFKDYRDMRKTMGGVDTPQSRKLLRDARNKGLRSAGTTAAIGAGPEAVAIGGGALAAKSGGESDEESAVESIGHGAVQGAGAGAAVGGVAGGALGTMGGRALSPLQRAGGAAASGANKALKGSLIGTGVGAAIPATGAAVGGIRNRLNSNNEEGEEMSRQASDLMERLEKTAAIGAVARGTGKAAKGLFNNLTNRNVNKATQAGSGVAAAKLKRGATRAGAAGTAIAGAGGYGAYKGYQKSQPGGENQMTNEQQQMQQVASNEELMDRLEKTAGALVNMGDEEVDRYISDLVVEHAENPLRLEKELEAAGLLDTAVEMGVFKDLDRKTGTAVGGAAGGFLGGLTGGQLGTIVGAERASDRLNDFNASQRLRGDGTVSLKDGRRYVGKHAVKGGFAGLGAGVLGAGLLGASIGYTAGDRAEKNPSYLHRKHHGGDEDKIASEDVLDELEKTAANYLNLDTGEVVSDGEEAATEEVPPQQPQEQVPAEQVPAEQAQPSLAELAAQSAAEATEAAQAAQEAAVAAQQSEAPVEGAPVEEEVEEPVQEENPRQGAGSVSHAPAGVDKSANELLDRLEKTASKSGENRDEETNRQHGKEGEKASDGKKGKKTEEGNKGKFAKGNKKEASEDLLDRLEKSASKSGEDRDEETNRQHGKEGEKASDGKKGKKTEEGNKGKFAKGNKKEASELMDSLEKAAANRIRTGATAAKNTAKNLGTAAREVAKKNKHHAKDFGIGLAGGSAAGAAGTSLVNSAKEGHKKGKDIVNENPERFGKSAEEEATNEKIEKEAANRIRTGVTATRNTLGNVGKAVGTKAKDVGTQASNFAKTPAGKATGGAAIGAGLVGAGAAAQNYKNNNETEDQDKTASEDEHEDMMTGLFKEAAAHIIDTELPEVKEHVDPMDRISF